MTKEDVSKYLLAYRKEANAPVATQPGWAAKVAFAKKAKNVAKAVGAAVKAIGKRAPVTQPPPVAEASPMLPMLRPPSALAPVYKATPSAKTGLWKKILGGTLVGGGIAGGAYGLGSAKNPPDPIPAPPMGKGLGKGAVAGAAAAAGGLGLSAYLLYRVLKRKSQAEE